MPKDKEVRKNPNGTTEVVTLRTDLERRDGHVVDQLDHYIKDNNTGEKLHEYTMVDKETGQITTGLTSSEE